MKQFITKWESLYGWNVLYDTAKSQMLEAGIILCYLPPSNRHVLFELDEDLDLFNATEVEALPGSMIANDGGGWYKDDPIGKIPISACRFPTKEELEEYEKIGSV